MTPPTAGRELDAIVIGAGANGLVAGAALGGAGLRVLLLEGTDHVGEEARPDEFAPGFRSAPLALDAGWLPPSLGRAGLNLGAIPMVDPARAVTVPSGDRAFLSLPLAPTGAAEAIRRYSAKDANAWAAFSGGMRKLSGFLEALYQLPPPDVDTTSLGDIAALWGVGRKFRALGRDHMAELLRVLPMPVQDLLDDAFECEVLKAAVGAGGVRDLRQGPRSGGTSFNLLHYLVGAPPGSMRARSWWRDGPDAFCLAAAESAQRHGVTIRTGASTARILIRDDAVAGVALTSGEEIRANIVLSTADPARTLLGMVDPAWLDPEFVLAVQNIKFRGCTVFVDYALDALPEVPGLDDVGASLGSIMTLTRTLEALERAADAAKYGKISEHPHVEITVPTLRWPSLAPAGKHVLVARAQFAPYTLSGTSWDESRATAVADQVTSAIEQVVPAFRDHILHRRILTPPDIESRFGLTGGVVTQGELMLDQILFMRPVAGSGRYAMPVQGLYLGGSGAHPGPGVVGGAGWLAARQIIADVSRPPKRSRGAAPR